MPHSVTQCTRLSFFVVFVSFVVAQRCGCNSSARPERRISTLALGTHFQHREKRLLRDLDFPDALHPLLAFLLLLEQLALAADVAAVAFGEHVLAQRLDRFARDDATANRRLDR